jgi:hypothetical protein
LLRFCASARALVGKGRFCLAVARQGWRRRFRQAGWQPQRFWRLRRRWVGQVLGNLGALVGNGRLAWQRLWKGERPFLFGDCPAGLGQTWLAKRFGQSSGFVTRGAGWSAKVLEIASDSVGKARLYSTRVMEGEWPFSCKLLGSSQRRSQFSQSASAQRFNSFTQASRQRRWSGVPPNTPSSRRWRDASGGLLFGDWQRFW